MSVDTTFNRLAETILKLAEYEELSLVVSAEENGRKTILLSAASEYEHLLCETVRDLTRQISKESPQIVALVEKKAISRQYHTWFDWNNNSASPFYSLFGDDFSTSMKELKKSDASFSDAHDAFLELGLLRNQLVHNNFATFHLEKTAAEIFERYKVGLGFIDRVKIEFQRIVDAANGP